MLKRSLLAFFCLVPAAIVLAAELGVGSTRDEVLAELGAPKSKLSVGAREILSYPNGRITLSEGKVTSIEWKKTAATPAPSVTSRPAQPSTTAPAASAKKVVPPSKPREVWLTDFAAAQAEAAGTGRRLLVLFTGSDWCPPCKQFEANVAHAPAFLNLTGPSFVLVKLDYPRHLPQSPEVRARNAELLRHYDVDSYPTLLVISADGKKSTRVDTRRERPAANIVDFFVQAVDEARQAKEKSSLWPW